MTTATQKISEILNELNRKCTHTKIQELLEVMNQDKIRRPDLVVKYGGKLLDESSESTLTPSKYWELHEIVGIAALDFGNESLASRCFQKLKKKFGKESARVQRLLGMELESKRNYGDAKKLYENILTSNPSNQLVKKRLISINVANGKIKEAIKLLVDHIKMCANDAMAWQQLASLYIAVNCFRHASFCYEELIMINPREPLFHLMYAELKYTIGRSKINDLVLSRQYFAMAVDVRPNHPRALIGMAMSAKAVAKANAKSKKLSEEETKLNYKVHSFAMKRLMSMYDKNSEMGKYVERVLKM